MPKRPDGLVLCEVLRRGGSGCPDGSGLEESNAEGRWPRSALSFSWQKRLPDPMPRGAHTPQASRTRVNDSR